MGAAVLTALVCALLASTAHAALDSAQKALEAQGRYWEDRNQPQRADDAWQKLLASSPKNTEALLHLGLIAARTGHDKEARHYVVQLKSADARSPEIALLEHAIHVGAINPQEIAQARKLARAGKYEMAMAIYRKALKNQAPPPDLAREYYETLAGTKTGWQEARAGLAQLATALPNDPSVQYAYARVLTYHEATRRNGIAMLATLSGDSSIGQDATRAWHDALVWLAATKADIPLYRNYLTSNPGDQVVEQKLAALKNPQTAPSAGKNEANARAFDALNAGHWAEAGHLFEALLKANPKDVDALGGLGVVREREGRLQEAQQFLSRAVSRAPGGKTRWRQALQSVIYLKAVKEGRAALAAHHPKLAAARAHEALAHPYRRDMNGELILADANVQMRHWLKAERIYRRVLRVAPHNPEARGGLATVMAATGRPAQARRLMPKGQQPALPADVSHVSAQRLAARTEAMLAHGQVNEAMAAYRHAMTQDSSNPWLKLGYARLLTRIGDRTDADRTIDAMLRAPNPTGDTLAAGAIWFGEHGNWKRAADLAERVPAGTLVADFPTLAHQWIAARDAQRAVQLAHQGNIAEAYRILNGIVLGARGNIGVVGVAADAFVKIGDPRRAVAVMRDAIGPSPTLDDEIQYAGVLLKVGRLNELTRVMHIIDEQANSTTPAQQARVADLHRGFAIQLADQARLKGDYAGAYDRLAPELAISHDPTVLAALARIYDSAGRHEEALEIYRRILHASPANADARREIITAAIQVGHYRQAHRLLKEGFAQSPNDPRLHLLAAELARAEGDDATALAQLNEAQADLSHQYGGTEIGYAGNPFRQSSERLGGGETGTPYVLAYSAYQTSPSYGTNPAYPVPEMGGAIRLVRMAPEDRQLATDVTRQLQQVKAPMQPDIQGGMELRNIDGESGLSQFSLVSLPISAGAMVGPGELTIAVTPTFAEAGPLDTADPGVFRRFGTNATIAPGGAAPDYDGSASGTGFLAGYKVHHLAVDLGVTPIGFPTENVISHLVWAAPISSTTSIKLTAFREPVIQSLLSYAGTRDPTTGNVWGGVIRDGGRLDIGYDNGLSGVYGDATGALLEGEHVAQNYMIDAGGGAYWRPYRSNNGNVKMGVNVSVQSYQKNLDYYTYGQGGYFSPQFAVEATVPVEYSGHWRGMSYSLNGQVGVMNFHAKSSPFFPLDPNLQALAETNSPAAFYPGQSITTAIYGISAKSEYEIAPLVILGAQVSADNSYNYDEQSLMIYLRKKFDVY
ncbi:MAG: cellulose synthase subunit BcsC-related outer membrane protein [Stellaceae bacterium]